MANAYLEGTYSEVYSGIGEDADGLRKLFRQFSFPGGVPSHVAAETPGSIHEGGELGYALVHAYGAAFDNPDLVVACVIGDGEAETGPLAASWHSNKFLNPVTDGAVLPILHLNGYKIANPTVLSRIPQEELESLFYGYGYRPITVAGDDPANVHQQMATALDEAFDQIGAIQQAARLDGESGRPLWPMIIMRTPKGWTGPKEVDGKKVEGTWRSHQVPLSETHTNPEHMAQLEQWLRSYRPEELFDEQGVLRPELRALAPTGQRRMSANPHANGGLLLRDLDLPEFPDYAVAVDKPATGTAEATRVLGTFLRDVIARNPDRFRLMGPDETASNRLGAVFESTDKAWLAEIGPDDEDLSPEGRVMEVLSEHLCQGWLEGYLLTGRHGLFNCYEAFVHIVDSMFNQHAKWLTRNRELTWRWPIASLNYLLTSHVWRQDHNGASHQDPGFIDHVANKRPEVVRVYLPPDANTLLSVADHCLRSRDYVNVIVAGKQPALTYLDMDAAIAHCTRGLGIWEWAGTATGEPDVVLACAGDIPTLETLAAADMLRARTSRFGGARDQRRRPHAIATGFRTPARAVRSRVRLVVHHRQAGHLRLPRLPVADPPADLPPDQPRADARPRVQGGGHHHHAVRHGDAQRPGPVPPGDRRHRPGATGSRAGPRRCGSGWSTPGWPPGRYTREHGEDDPEISGWTWDADYRANSKS